jgi:hypothetical protein
VYLVDVDASALRFTADEPELQDLQQRYRDFSSRQGTDLSVGLRLGDLLTDAGLTVERCACRAPGASRPAWDAATILGSPRRHARGGLRH